jgi:alpha-L-fucosidase
MNHPAYGTPAYNDVYVNMMKEIFTNYGPIWELWWDGANGEGPNGKKQVYDWPKFKETVRKLSPNTVVFSDVGPDLRWIGNENGFAGETNWNMLNTDGFTAGTNSPKTSVLNEGEEYGKYWIPGECDVSIRPGWFNHSNEDGKVKPPEELFGLYLKSVGRGANLLLNVPPDGRGLFSANDSAALMGFKKLRDESFKSNLAGKIGKLTNNSITVVLKNKQPINCVVLHEPIAKGQFIAKGKLQVLNGKAIIAEKDFTTIGRKRILTFPTVEATAIKILVEESKAPAATINEVEVYKIAEPLIKE